MEAGRSFIGQTPLPLQTFGEWRAIAGKCTVSATSTWRHFPTSVRSPEPRDEFRPPLLKKHSSPQVSQFMTLEKAGAGISEEKEEEGSDDEDWDRLSLDVEDSRSSSWADLLTLILSMDYRPSSDVVEIAKLALTASKEAAASSTGRASVDDNFGSTRLGSSASSSSLLDEVIAVRSTKRLQRESVRRKVTITRDMDSYSTSNNTPKKATRVSRSDGPIRNFLRGRETTRLLTAEEECKLSEDIQELLRLEEVKSMFELKFGRQPTLPEWAQHVGLSCNTLTHQLQRGNRSREKLIKYNLRVVVHIAKHYEGHGLSLRDLLQEGSLGLIKSVDKFIPQEGCRFASYAYWGIRVSIQKAINQHSRIVRLPDRVHNLLKQVKNAKRSCFQEGNYNPTSEEIARRVGIAPYALIKLLHLTRFPCSLDRRVWRDQNITHQDIIADPKTEDPLVVFAKQMMELRLLELVKGLPPKESQIICLRYGLDGRRPQNMSEIGKIIGLSRERVRILQNRALEKVKQSIPPEDKKAYVALVTNQL